MNDAREASAPFAGVVLAAGRSSRMGRCKAALEIDGSSFVARCVAALAGAGIAPIVVVTSDSREEVVRALGAPPDVQIAVNPNPERGQLSSLHVALRHLLERPEPCRGAVVGLVDHPL